MNSVIFELVDGNELVVAHLRQFQVSLCVGNTQTQTTKCPHVLMIGSWLHAEIPARVLLDCTNYLKRIGANAKHATALQSAVMQIYRSNGGTGV